MEILKQSSDQMMILLGKNPFYKDKKYRLNKYCFIHDYKGVKLILNHLSCSMVAMTEEEFDRIYETKNAYTDPEIEYVGWLIDNFYLVLEDYNEKEITDKLKEHLRVVIDDNYLRECYDYIMFPTTTCNARCFYCYENPMKKMPMSIDMAEKVARYIMKKAPNKDKLLSLRWFGGEPLFNVKVMRYIMNLLKAQGYNISTSIISNAYLFDEKMVKEAIEEWHLTNIQITIDGTEEVYNKAKNYIYKDQDKVSPFKKVIKNVGLLAEQGINVVIRMNTDMYNVEDLKDLVRYIKKTYPNYPNLSTYCYPIFEDENNPRTDKEKEELYTKLWELEDVMRECDLFPKAKTLDNHVQYNHCMVDNGKCINIHPDGTLGLCEHFIDSDIWGHIDDDSNEVIDDWSIIHSWREYVQSSECATCPIYPQCIMVKKCSNLNYCDRWWQEVKFRRTRDNMEGVYDELLKYIEQQNSCCAIGGNSCGNQTNDVCYCIEQVCEDKSNWCYCISQQKEVEIINTEHKCDGDKCTCKKEKESEQENDLNQNPSNKTTEKDDEEDSIVIKQNPILNKIKEFFS